MTELDRVINGLKKMLEESKYNDSVQYNPWADTETLEAAIAIIQSQRRDIDNLNADIEAETRENLRLAEMVKLMEARVLTFEEVIDWDGALLFESQEYGVEEWEFFKGTYEHGGETMCTTIEPDGDWNRWRKKLYGKTWRCWTSRPTDKQREKEPWNG